MNPYRSPAPRDAIPIHIERPPLRHRVRELYPLRLLAAAGVAVVVIRTIAGCHGLPGDSTTDAELAYRATLLRCVDKAKTLAESKACRRQADLEWLTQDGGK